MLTSFGIAAIVLAACDPSKLNRARIQKISDEGLILIPVPTLRPARLAARVGRRRCWDRVQAPAGNPIARPRNRDAPAAHCHRGQVAALAGVVRFRLARAANCAIRLQARARSVVRSPVRCDVHLRAVQGAAALVWNPAGCTQAPARVALRSGSRRAIRSIPQAQFRRPQQPTKSANGVCFLAQCWPQLAPATPRLSGSAP